MSALGGTSEAGEMSGAGGKKKEIIGKDARRDIKGVHVEHPWSQEQSDKHHGEGTSLRNAVGSAVGATEPKAKGVVDID